MSTEQERSLSRGRQDAFHSSGRGGSGNIRRSSTSRDARLSTDGPDDFSSTRGREMAVTPKVTHSGRGGAGNVRSPSRDPANCAPTAVERETIALAAEAEAELPHSSGRGGFGNISRSKSRSRPPDNVHSSGRGGAGNIVSGATDQERLEEQERREHQTKEGIHSSGRGGAGNIVSSVSPGIDGTPHANDPHQIHSSGRGGVGNIREASRSRDPSVPRTSIGGHSREKSMDRGGMAGLLGRAMSKERKQ